MRRVRQKRQGKGSREAVLRKADYVVAMERHHDLAAALGLPAFAVGCGFRYVEEGELPEGLSDGDLVKV